MSLIIANQVVGWNARCKYLEGGQEAGLPRRPTRVWLIILCEIPLGTFPELQLFTAAATASLRSTATEKLNIIPKFVVHAG